MRTKTIIALLPALAGLVPLVALADDLRPAASGGGSPGGSSLQLQYNNAGAFGGMAGTSWDATKQNLSLAQAPSISGAGALTVAKGAGSSSVLDLVTDYSGKALRILVPPDQSSLSPVTYIGNGGEIATRAWMTISGSTSGSGDGYVINTPFSSSYATMANIWADVPYTLVLRTFNANGGFNITALDRNANFRFMMPEDGSLTFGPSTASTPAGIDTGLSRIGTASMAIGNGTSGDYSGSLKLTTLKFADGTTQTTATTGSGVTGLTIASGKSLTVNNIITLAGVDSKTLTVNNSLTFAGTDGTTMTLPAVSASLAGLGVAQTWSAAQTHNASVVLANSVALAGTLSGGGTLNLINLDSGNNLTFGSSSLSGNLAFAPGTGKELRFLNAAQSAYIIDISESSRTVSFGSNTSNSIWTFYDSTATTGDSVISLRDGMARGALSFRRPRRWIGLRCSARARRRGCSSRGGRQHNAFELSGISKARSIVTPALTYATLPPSPTAGQRAYITDANANTWGSIGDSYRSLDAEAVLYNGSNRVVD